MNFITITSYLLSCLFLLLLLKAIWKVLPQFFPAFGRFKHLLRNGYINAGIWSYKIFGFKEFQFNRNGRKVKVMAKDRDFAYRKFKAYTKTNRNNGIHKL